MNPTLNQPPTHTHTQKSHQLSSIWKNSRFNKNISCVYMWYKTRPWNKSDQQPQNINNFLKRI